MRIVSIVLSSWKLSRVPLNFVPQHEPIRSQDVTLLQQFIDTSSNLFIITGAGMSTESGIPDYRSEGVGLYARTNHRPMKIQEFLSSSQARKRYWARNFIGWPTFSKRNPNPAHFAVEQWRRKGKVRTIVTQNVDHLHHKAGSTGTLELHGTAHRVICLQCHQEMGREEFQGILDHANPYFTSQNRLSQVRPDGDVHLEESEVDSFVLPSCPLCRKGILQPDIVFFGANVKRDKVDRIYGELAECDTVLVLGSSLQVFSSLRFVLRAKEMHLRIGILTLGETRGDQLADLKIKARLGEILPLIVT